MFFYLFADSHMTRKTPPAYSDGVYMMSGQNRPSPRKLSSMFMKGSDGLPSSRNLTAMLAFFGTQNNRPARDKQHCQNGFEIFLLFFNSTFFLRTFRKYILTTFARERLGRFSTYADRPGDTKPLSPVNCVSNKSPNCTPHITWMRLVRVCELYDVCKRLNKWTRVLVVGLCKDKWIKRWD